MGGGPPESGWRPNVPGGGRGQHRVFQHGAQMMGMNPANERDVIARQRARRDADERMDQIRRDRNRGAESVAAHTQPTYNKMAEFLEEAYIYKK